MTSEHVEDKVRNMVYVIPAVSLVMHGVSNDRVILTVRENVIVFVNVLVVSVFVGLGYS